MSKIQLTDEGPKVWLNIQYDTGFLLVTIKEIKELAVPTGKIYARSALSHVGDSDQKTKSQEDMEHITEMVDATANPSFKEPMMVM